MDHGFYQELDDLRKDVPDADFGFLENISVSEERNAFQYLHGFCDEFAAMLSEIYGYEIESARHWETEGFTGKLIHAYCLCEVQGKLAYIDVRGITTDPERFFEEFENEVTYFPGDGSLEDLEGPATIEWWPNKDALFDGDYEGWTDDSLKSFILENSDYYNAVKLDRKKPLDQTIQQAASRTGKSNDAGIVQNHSER